MTFDTLPKSILYLVAVVVFSLIGRVDAAFPQIGGMTLEPDESPEQYHSFINLLQNGDFEIDDDADGFPDGWLPWKWLVEDRLELRKAILDYLKTSPEAIARPRLTTRFPFFGKRSLTLISIDAKTGPGLYLTREFSPGIYTTSLYAKNPGEGKRELGVFLAAGGRLFEVGQRWRNIVYSQKLPYYVRGGEVSFRDWTFLPGELLLDRVVLWKLPFDLQYADRLKLSGDGDRFVVEFSEIDEILIPVGINLEIKAPSGEVIRKNIEGTLDSPEDDVVFEIKPQIEGEYRLKLEIYDLRTADVIFSDDGITAFYETADTIRTVMEGGEADVELDFFPVGIRAHGHELGNLRGRDFNSVLITEPAVDLIDLYRNFQTDTKMKLFFEITPETMSKGCDEEFQRLADLSRTIEGFSGWFISHPLPENSSFYDKQVEFWQCLDQEFPDLPIVVENYLPRGHAARDSLPFRFVAIDPNPISEPSRPIFTIGLWADQIAGRDRFARVVGMPQVFGGWPVAHRVPAYREVRGMTYLAAIHGAKGIIFRDFSSLRPFFDQSDASWDIRKVSELWDEIPSLNRELITLSPYFMECQVDRKGIVLDQEEFIDFGSWFGDRSLLLVAVNVYDGEIDAVFSLEKERFGGEVDVLFEERTITMQEGRLSDHFDPLETHVYRMTPVVD